MDAQADLSLCRAHRLFCWFCHEVAQRIEEFTICPYAEGMQGVLMHPPSWANYLKIMQFFFLSETDFTVLGLASKLVFSSYDSHPPV